MTFVGAPIGPGVGVALRAGKLDSRKLRMELSRGSDVEQA
jgi:hypothetical protein